MAETPAQRRYRDDARLLAVLGAHLAGQLSPMTVRLPRAVAEAAARAWERDETDPPGPESGEQAYVRAFAAAYALIGLEIQQSGIDDDDVVMVTLDPARVAAAMFAHECRTEGLLRNPPEGDTGRLS